MKIISLLLFVLLLSLPALTQQPSKQEMQSQMKEALNEIKKQVTDLEKQITDAKKNKEDGSVIKELEDQKSMLQAQVTMMEGLNKTMSGIPEKTFKQAGEKEAIVPKKDIARINSIPQKIFTDAELAAFIITAHAEVEKIIPALERTGALQLYNETKAEYRSNYAVANAATGCWMAGHWEKALFIMGRACMNDKADPDNLNNYASFLTMTGAGHAALPILQWLNNKYPRNSTVLNNLGQAWFELGDMKNAEEYLVACTKLDTNHSQANASLSKIYQARRDTARAVTFLKRSIKETYDPEKEAELARLGVTLTYKDMPRLNYPMKDDPIGLVAFVQSFPEDDQGSLGDEEKVYAIQRYRNGLYEFMDDLGKLGQRLSKKSSEFSLRMSVDKSFSEAVLRAHNNPAYMLASNLLRLWAAKMHSMSPSPAQLLLPLTPPADEEDPMTDITQMIHEMAAVYVRYQNELVQLKRSDSEMGPPGTCEEQDMRTNAYLAKAAALRKTMIQSIKQKFIDRSPKLRELIKAELYGRPDMPVSYDEMTYRLVSGLIENNEDPENKDLVAKTAFLSVSQFANQVVNTAGVHQKCRSYSQIRNETAVLDLSVYYRKELVCEFEKTIETPGYSYKFKCNLIIDDPASKLKKRTNRNPQGAAKSNKGGGGQGTGGPGSGPAAGLFEDAELFYDNSYLSNGPLTEEQKDLSQFSIEYNKWGNLVGLNLQLNKEGTALADPDAVNSGMESRWSWNAAAVVEQGPLHKLLLKK